MLKNILIVDDDQDFIDLYTAFLGKEFQIHAVTSLKECLSFLAKNPFKIDLILCDIFMPESDGFEVFDYLRSKKEYSFYPIVFKTSSLNQNVLNECLLAKNTELISTLMSNQEIVIRIKSELKNSNLIKYHVNSNLALLIDKVRGEILYPTPPFQLSFTKTELDIIELLACSTSALAREDVITKVFGEGYHLTENNFNTVLSGIRKKLCEFSISIKSIRGKGIVLCQA